MEMLQLMLGATMALLYLILQVVIFWFNWGRIYDNPTPPAWQCGYHKLTLITCIISSVVAGAALFGFGYGIISLAAK